MKTHTLRLLFCLLAVVYLAGTAPAQTGNPFEQLKAYRFGGDRAVLDAVAQQVSESRANPVRKRQVARALASVLQSDAAFDAKQFACRQLILIATEEQSPTLVRLLQDEQLAHYALMVLARIPGEAVNAALRRELSRSRGRAQLEIMDTLGDRRDLKAVPLLTKLLRSADPAVAEASATALAKMADSRLTTHDSRLAVQSLQQAYAQSSGDRRLAFGHALLDCAQRLRQEGRGDSALPIYELLVREPASPPIRAAVLRGLAQVEGEKAVPLVLKALGEDGTPRQKMAAALARTMPGSQTTRRLSAYLPKLTVRGQLLLLAALSDRGDRAAAPAVSALCRSSDGAVRLAALNALGALGDAATVPALLHAASSGPPEERDAARAGLARLRAPMVDGRLIRALDSGQPAECAEAIRALGERHVTAAVPRLVREARSPQREVGAAAVRVLRAMGRPEHLPALLDLLLATPPGERDETMGTIAEIARRGANENERAGAILQRLSTVSRPADRVDLLSLLGEIGGSGALAALREAVADPALEVQLTALRLLAEWPTDEPMADLLRTVRTTQDEKQRTIALRGYVRLIGINEQRSSEDALALYREAASLARSPEEKRMILSGLAKLRSPAALDYASSFLADEAVRAEAELAVVEIGRGTVGAYREKTRAALEPIAQGSANENARKGAQDVLAVIGKFGDFVTAWEVSPAYQQEDANYSKLFDIPFPPEQPDREKEVPWRLMPAGTNPDQPWLLDLLALWGGEQRVSYLRTAVWSDAARDLVLELGSDDGAKVWWNGQVVFTDNTAHGIAPAQQKIKLHAEQGWNRLLLKITQNIMGWGVCARFTHPDGSSAVGVRCAAPWATDMEKTGP
jgi:HEAT repeat protein